MSAVTLGPQALLHTGYHGALIEHPPPGIQYDVIDPTVLFDAYLGQRQPFAPHEHFSVAEAHLYPGRPRFIHSAHYPIANKDVPWIVDTDSLLAHVQFGAVAVSPRLRRWLERPGSPPLVAERTARMLDLFASPSCGAICFHCRGQLAQNRSDCLRTLPASWGGCIDEIFRKATVCYPAQPPRLSRPALRARNRKSKRGVVFAARAFLDKGGAVALSAFRTLLSRGDVELCYIGPLPLADQRKYSDVLGRIHYAPRVARDLLFEILGQAHIFVCPSRHEALGITLLEALSFGLAVVTSTGPGMENVREIIHEGAGGLLVPKPARDADVSATRLVAAIVSLLDDSATYRAMADYNLSLVEDGDFSLEERDKTLRALYSASPPSSGLARISLKVMRAAVNRGGGRPRRRRITGPRLVRLRRRFIQEHYPPEKSAVVIPACPVDLEQGAPTRSASEMIGASVL